jgi:hypothetical protein
MPAGPSGERGIRTPGPPFGRHSISNAAQSATLPSLRTPKRASGTACGRIWQSGRQSNCPNGSGPAMRSGPATRPVVRSRASPGVGADHGTPISVGLPACPLRQLSGCRQRPCSELPPPGCIVTSRGGVKSSRCRLPACRTCEGRRPKPAASATRMASEAFSRRRFLLSKGSRIHPDVWSALHTPHRLAWVETHTPETGSLSRCRRV